MKKFKVVVAHPYKQHSFELAEGLRRNGLLYKYITTVYYKRYNITGFFTRLFKGQNKEKALSRYDKRIDPYVIQFCEAEGLFKLLTMKITILNGFYEKVKYHSSDRFAKKVAKYCIKNKVDAVVVFDDTSPLCAEVIKNKAPNIRVIMDMSAPALPYMSSIYKEDMRKQPNYANKLRSETRKALDPKLLRRAQREIDSADYFLVASEFSKKSLIFSGVLESKIALCRYGINLEEFVPGNRGESKILKAVYIGGTKQYKGISYLIDAFKKLINLPVELIVVGNNDLSYNEVLPNVSFTGIIMHHQVAELLKQCDFSIFPSLGDGFGFSVIEALSAGCPVICSVNAGACDLIRDHFNGFRIHAQNSSEIVDRIHFFIENGDKLEEMKINARNSVQELTWAKYYQTVATTINRVINESPIQ